MSATMLSTSTRNFSRFRVFAGNCLRFLSSNETKFPNNPSNDSNKSLPANNDKSSEDVVKSLTSSTEAAATTTTPAGTSEATNISGFTRAFERIEKLIREEESEEEPKSFASMIRQSKLMEIGEPAGRVVLGTIFDVVEDDLYIDFGGKFHCVCKRPSFRASDYKQGVAVKLRLKDFEMTSKFLGSDKHVTLLEADAVLIGLHRPHEWTKSENRPQSVIS